MTDFILIVGGGTFGVKAAEYVLNQGKIGLVIDQNNSCPAQKIADYHISSLNEFFENLSSYTKGSIAFLQAETIIIIDIISKGHYPSFIIPVVPIHLMAAVVQDYFRLQDIDISFHGQNLDDFVQQVDPKLLLDFSQEHGVAFLSYAQKGELCPNNCFGPPDYCSNFKREKPITITKYVREHFNMAKQRYSLNLSLSSLKIVIESMQLVGGLGGIKGSSLSEVIKLLDQEAEFFQTNPFDMLIATTCNCHGVITFFTKTERPTSRID